MNSRRSVVIWLWALSLAALPAAGQPRLQKISGDGQLVQLFYAFTQPLVVQAVDSSGRPLTGRTVTWSDVGGISYAGPKVVTTDANGYASLTWVPGGEVATGMGYHQYTVTASSDVGEVTFTLVSYPYLSGAFNPQPSVQLIKPAQGAGPITVQSGGRVADAVRVVVVTSGGGGVSPGLPIPGVGLTVKSANQDPGSGPVAACTGGTVLTGADGFASCELLAQGLPGTTDLVIDAGNLVTFRAQLQVTAGDPVPVITQGDRQSGSPGQSLPLRLTARLQSAAGAPLPGTAAAWSVIPTGSVSLVTPVTTADAGGLVSTGVQLGATPGVYEVRVTTGANYASFQVTVLGTAPGLTVTSNTLPAGTAGVPYVQNLGATGGVAPYSWQYVSGSLPSGVTIGTNGTVSGTPLTGGNFTFSVRVTDSRGASATGSVSLAIGAGLAVATVSLPNGVVGAPYSQLLAAAGGAPPYTWSLATGGIVASQLPPGLTISPAGLLSGTPLAAGSTTFTLRVSDSSGREAFQFYTMVVATAPAQPLAISSPTALPAGTLGTAYSQRLAASGGAPPYSWSQTGGLLPAGLSLASDGLIFGTPLAAGTASFSARVTDARSTQITQTFTLTIAGGLAVTTSTLPKGAAGVAYQQTLAASGGSGAYTWTITQGSLPPGMTLSPAGVLSGTPAAAGAFFFSLRVTDSAGASAAGLLALEIQPAGTLSRVGVFSQLATGGGWKTTINLLNVQASPVQVKVSLVGDDGLALELPYVVTQGGQSTSVVGASLERTLPAGSSLLIEVDAQISSTLVGWAEVQASAPVSGYAIFRQRGGDGRDSEGTSPLETRAQAGVLAPFDNLTGYSTGVALVNLSAAQASVTVVYRDENGAEIGRDTLGLAGNGHTSFSLPDKFPVLSGRRGVVEFVSNQAAGLAALGLRFNPTLSFTSVPVAVR
jgi:hypothetical protein